MKWTASMGYRRFPDLPLDPPEGGHEEQEEDQSDDSTPIHPEQDEGKSAAAYRRGLTDAAGIVASKAKEYTLKADQYWRDDKRTLARDFDAYAVAALHCIAAIRRAGGGQ
jgi:hypothetical protein